MFSFHLVACRLLAYQFPNLQISNLPTYLRTNLPIYQSTNLFPPNHIPIVLLLDQRVPDHPAPGRQIDGDAGVGCSHLQRLTRIHFAQGSRDFVQRPVAAALAAGVEKGVGAEQCRGGLCGSFGWRRRRAKRGRGPKSSRFTFRPDDQCTFSSSNAHGVRYARGHSIAERLQVRALNQGDQVIAPGDRVDLLDH